MKDEESQISTISNANSANTISSGTTTTASGTTMMKKDGFGNGNNNNNNNNDGGLFGRGKYKLWALAAIILLALWSMFTGSVTLKWSAGNLNHVSDEFDSSVHDDFDILEIEEREKTVRRMWDIYTHNSAIRLPSFWQAAFKAAYEDLTSEVPAVRDAAVSEIAKMSLRSSRSYAVEFETPAESNDRASDRKDTQSRRVGKTRGRRLR